MDPIQIEKLRVHPEEINQATGRIRINSKSLDHPVPVTRSLRPHSFETLDSKESFGDLHRIWFPFLSVVGFILCGVIFFISHQRIAGVEKKILELTSLQNKSQKEFTDSIERFKGEVNQEKIPAIMIQELKNSLKEQEIKTLELQKKIESFHLKEILILESNKEEASPTVPPK